MVSLDLSLEDERRIDDLVAAYQANHEIISRHLLALHAHISECKSLVSLVHSVKWRMKDADHLRDKLRRKILQAREKSEEFSVTAEDICTQITDLAGYRILHLHTRQMSLINPALLQVLDEAEYRIVHGPKANVWDQETQKYFQGIGIEAEFHPRMYSSVHYVVQPSSKTKVTIEIQVRTLSEEVWGEVDHKFNYPYAVDSIACSEQIKVLARVASSCTRLVDSIFASYEDWQVTAEAGEAEGLAPPPPSPIGDEPQSSGGT